MGPAITDFYTRYFFLHLDWCNSLFSLIWISHVMIGRLISCAALPSSSPSGYYWVETSTGSYVRVFCDMTRSCGNITGGWIRVANIDSKNGCPSELSKKNNNCRRSPNGAGCSSVDISAHNFNYSKVCGRIIGKQVQTPDGIESGNINAAYVDGVSLTHGRAYMDICSSA